MILRVGLNGMFEGCDGKLIKIIAVLVSLKHILEKKFREGE